jgi:xanthine dehydrogenase accessory factor
MTREEALREAVARHGRAVLVTVEGVQGSTPRGTDAWMVISDAGFRGTVGGGTLEWQAQAEAQKLLAKGNGEKALTYVLGPDLGQCCGGRMNLRARVVDEMSLPNVAQESPIQRSLLLFGAGHVGRALVLALAPLPFRLVWADNRPGAFPSHVPGNVTCHSDEDPTVLFNHAPKGSLAYVMTHSHALDLNLVQAALQQPDIAHTAVIGSATKRARFEKRLHEAGVAEDRVRQLICPIGIGGIASKLPAAIAAATVAQILQLDSALTMAETDMCQHQQAV